MLYRQSKGLTLLNGHGKEQVKATLIFAPARKYRFLNYLLKPGFAHCRVIIHKPDYQVYIDPRVAYTSVECYSNCVNAIPNEGETFVQYTGMVDIYKTRRFFGPLNCVETVKGFIGIRKPFIFTPYQLYKEVMKHGRNTRR